MLLLKNGWYVFFLYISSLNENMAFIQNLISCLLSSFYMGGVVNWYGTSLMSDFKHLNGQEHAVQESASHSKNLLLCWANNIHVKIIYHIYQTILDIKYLTFIYFINTALIWECHSSIWFWQLFIGVLIIVCGFIVSTDCLLHYLETTYLLLGTFWTYL